MSRHVLPLLLAAAVLAAAAGARAAAEAAAACPAGSVRAVIAGKPVCLRAGQPCRRALDRQYHRYRFHCHGGRLTRFPSPPASADLRLAVDQTGQATLGGVRFRIEVANLGPSVAQGVTVVAAVTGGAVVSASLGGASCSIEGARATCTIGPVASPGGVTLVLDVRPARPGEVSVRASVSGTTRDPQPGNNAASFAATVPEGDYARGEGARSAYGGGTWRFALDAWSGAHGEHPGGTFRIRYETDAGTRHAAGEVVCLTVSGNRAAAGGVVEETDDGAFFGRFLTFFRQPRCRGRGLQARVGESRDRGQARLSPRRPALPPCTRPAVPPLPLPLPRRPADPLPAAPAAAAGADLLGPRARAGDRRLRHGRGSVPRGRSSPTCRRAPCATPTAPSTSTSPRGAG